MEFWGVEVKSGEPLEVVPGDDMLLHLSQACLGEVKKDKGNESIFLYVNIDDQKLVLGTLSANKFPQISFDLVFEKKFELSHNWKNGSVYFSGYKSPTAIDYESDGYSGSDSDFGEDFPVYAANNGKPESQAKQVKPAAEKASVVKPDSTTPKQRVKIVEPNKDVKPNEKDDDSDDEESSEAEDESEDEDMVNGQDDSNEDDDSDEDDDDESDEDEETPNKAAPSKKRLADSAIKTPVPDKKVKLVTPQRTDGKKGGAHTATPHPSKQATKTPAENDKSKQQSPKAFQCKSCNRSFVSDNALQSHTKAKHSAAK